MTRRWCLGLFMLSLAVAYLSHETEAHDKGDGSCPNPYTHEFENSCYVATLDNDLTHQGLNAFCEDIEGYLLRIDSQEEADFIVIMTTEIGINDTNIHIGINDLFENEALRYTGNKHKRGRLLTSDDYRSPTYESDLETGQGCFYLAGGYYDNITYWRDDDCDDENYGICEFDKSRRPG